ncbi:MAG: iron dependent repressor, metal binding and dimerization domain protein [Erysipelotrichaceae bacterium]|nr:iron dependent repressor, metal binding and dimerization domain protein [Erysipelotrichaceae bacterium]
MGYSKPSVSRAMGLLKNGGYVTVDEDGSLSLTEAGREIAEKIYDRHTVLADFLVRLGVDQETAIKDACRIEHVISDQSFQAIKNHVKF